MGLVPSYEAAIIVQIYLDVVDHLNSVPMRLITDGGSEATSMQVAQVRACIFFLKKIYYFRFHCSQRDLLLDGSPC